MKYIVESLSYDWPYNQFALPTCSAEIRLIPKTRKDCTDIEKALFSKNYEDVSRLGLIFNSHSTLPSIKNVYFNDPVTVVLWDDGTKTIVRCQNGDTYSKEVGLAMCIAKKTLGNKGNYNDIFKKWIPEEEKPARGRRSKLNIDEWDKTRDGLSDKLYRCVKEACALDEATRTILKTCNTCKHREDVYVDPDPCYSCDLSIHSNWKSAR